MPCLRRLSSKCSHRFRCHYHPIRSIAPFIHYWEPTIPADTNGTKSRHTRSFTIVWHVLWVSVIYEMRIIISEFLNRNWIWAGCERVCMWNNRLWPSLHYYARETCFNDSLHSLFHPSFLIFKNIPLSILVRKSAHNRNNVWVVVHWLWLYMCVEETENVRWNQVDRKDFHGISDGNCMMRTSPAQYITYLYRQTVRFRLHRRETIIGIRWCRVWYYRKTTASIIVSSWSRDVENR